MDNNNTSGVWDASQCALLLIDYQEHVLDFIFEQDRRLIEFNARTIAEAAVKFGIPVILSTVGVKMGVNHPTIAPLRAALPGVSEIDRSSLNAWDDPAFVAAVKATGRKRLVMGGIVTSVCLAFPAVDAIADGFEVRVLEDAVGDRHRHVHDTAMARLIQAGAVPNSTLSMITEWFRDWKSPLATPARPIIVSYLDEVAALESAPQFQPVRGGSAQPRA